MLRSSIESIESMQISHSGEGTENTDSVPGCPSPHLSSTVSLVSLLCVVGKLLNPALLSASVVPGSLEEQRSAQVTGWPCYWPEYRF